MSQKRSPRPTGLTLVIAYEILSGISSLLASAIDLYFSFYFGELGYLGYSTHLLGSTGIGLAIGLASLGIAGGNLKRKGWSWNGAILLQFLGIALTIIYFLAGRTGPPSVIISIISDLLGIVVIAYLLRSSVQDYFGKGLHPTPLEESHQKAT